MAYADQEMSGNKIIAIVIVALIHLAVGYALVTGLAYSAAKKLVERVTTIDIEEPEPEEELPPPPEPENRPPPQIQVQPNTPPPAPIARIIPPAAPPAPPPPRFTPKGPEPRNNQGS